MTPQAVSRWECGSAMPDISLIPQIAYLFEVTSDHLLGIDITRVDEEVEEIIKSTYPLKNVGNNEEVITIYREGLKKFPNNYKLQNCLVSELYLTSCSTADDEKRRAMNLEAQELAQHILDGCTNSEIRNSTTALYVNLLDDAAKCGFAKDAAERAKTIASQAPSKSNCREELLLTLMTREEAFEQLGKNVYDLFFMELPCYLLYMDENPSYTTDEQLAAFERIQKIYAAAMPDDEPYFHSWHNNMMWGIGAKLYLKKWDSENALYYVRMQADEAIRWDSNRYSPDENAGTFVLKSVLFKGITAAKGHVFTNSSESYSRYLFSTLNGENYTMLRGNPEFETILAELEESAKKYE